VSARRKQVPIAVSVGTAVRFTVNGLGASERDNLNAVTGDTYGVDEVGTVAFRHPNVAALPHWFYVQVWSKSGKPRDLFVGVDLNMCEVIS